MAGNFSEQEADAWRDDLVAHAPSLAGIDAESLPEMVGVALRADTAGVVYRLRARDGLEVTFRMNAVAARILAVATLGESQSAGWLDDDGQLVAALSN